MPTFIVHFIFFVIGVAKRSDEDGEAGGIFFVIFFVGVPEEDEDAGSRDRDRDDFDWDRSIIVVRRLAARVGVGVLGGLDMLILTQSLLLEVVFFCCRCCLS